MIFFLCFFFIHLNSSVYKILDNKLPKICAQKNLPVANVVNLMKRQNSVDKKVQ